MGVFVIEKILSDNDLGITGSHQAGMLIPKQQEFLDFFPKLDINGVNPRTYIYFTDEFEQQWKLNYIYYNNKLRGGTRNEYRLTGMTAYFRYKALKTGDIVVLKKDEEDNYKIDFKRGKQTRITAEEDIVHITISNSWKIINYRRKK